jgi:spoIIIJ-associated protein
MINHQKEIVETIIRELFEKMGFSPLVVEITETAVPLPSLYCAIQVADGQNFLIGQYGMNLSALQHLVRILARKTLEEKIEIIVDINDYFLEKKQLLEKEAEQALKEALQNNVSVKLRPMLPYERKIVHALLSTNESVVTESVGVGDARRVMICPKPLTLE